MGSVIESIRQPPHRCRCRLATPVRLKSLGTAAKLLEKPLSDVRLLGSEEQIRWSQGADVLTIEPAKDKPCDDAFVCAITSK